LVQRFCYALVVHIKGVPPVAVCSVWMSGAAAVKSRGKYDWFGDIWRCRGNPRLGLANESKVETR